MWQQYSIYHKQDYLSFQSVRVSFPPFGLKSWFVLHVQCPVDMSVLSKSCSAGDKLLLLAPELINQGFIHAF